MAVDSEQFLTFQRKRAAGAILGFCERAEWYETLTPSERNALRDKVLSTLGNYHDALLDMTRALDGTGALNGAALELLQEIHGAIVPTPMPSPPRRERQTA